MMNRSGTPSGRQQGGFAVLSVIMVLMALLVLSAPFLMTARNATRASDQLSDRVQARLALDAAARHARAQLGASHPAVDETPYFDDLEELYVDAAFPEEFWNQRDRGGVLWDLEVRDVSGLIDLNSAPPQLFANLIGNPTLTVEPIEKGSGDIKVSNTSGFPPEGFVWVDRELIHYRAVEGRSLTDVLRGLASATDADGNPLDCGPGPAESHGRNRWVIDQRAIALAEWRTVSDADALREYDDVEQVRQAAKLSLAGSIEDEVVDTIARWTSPYAEVRAGRQWQRASRLINQIDGGLDCILQLDETGWFSPGTTVMITDGLSTEFGLVQTIGRGAVRLFQPLVNDYLPYTAEVRPLARRPVNVNIAPPEVLELLFRNLQLQGQTHRITDTEARALAGLVVESRPFTGHEDFLRRVVLPAGGLEPLPEDALVKPDSIAEGGALISEEDAQALYRNCLNANDSRLSFSTMPLCYTSRDTFDMELRASINATSGVERVAAVRNQVEMVVPQRELMQLWARQEDFDEALRLDREAPWWASGPHATTRYDATATAPPSRYRAHFAYPDAGTSRVVADSAIDGGTEAVQVPAHIFASREEDGYIQLMPSREDEATDERAGHVLHFDQETSDPEGRSLVERPIRRKTDGDQVQWTSQEDGGLLGPISLSMWIRPRSIPASGLLLDTGQNSNPDTDRVTLGFEEGDLVLRVRDAGGDHLATDGYTEAGEVRYELAQGNGPGLLADTWSHVFIDVRGTRPDQMTMLIDGRDFGVRTPGLSRLQSPLSLDTGLIFLEDGEGFPERGVVRIGNELIEYTRSGDGNTLQAIHTTAGQDAGFGGRLAREGFDTQSGLPGLNAAIGKDVDHEVGTPVSLYGYSIPVESNVPAAEGQLEADLSRYRVGYVTAVSIDGNDPTNFGEPIVSADTFYAGTTQPVLWGTGLEGNRSRVTGIVLDSADNPSQGGGPFGGGEPDPTVMAAFNPNGGLAVMFQQVAGSRGSSGRLMSSNGSVILGYEIFQYTGYDAETNLLALGARGVEGRTREFTQSDEPMAPHAFVVNWQNVFDENRVDLNTQLEWKVFVAPISIAVEAASDFLDPVEFAEFAQITHVDDAENTEWVCYDQVVNLGGADHLVRNEWDALWGLTQGITGRGSIVPPQAPPGNSAPAPPGLTLSSPVQPPPRPPAAQQSSGQSSAWLPYMGDPEDGAYAQEFPVSTAARDLLQFRGMFGTRDREHLAGSSTVLPVWKVRRGGVDTGRPGRGDNAFLFDAAPDDPGWPVVVHRAFIPHRPSENNPTFVSVNGEMAMPVPGGRLGIPRPGNEFVPAMDLDVNYVALNEAAPVPIAWGSVDEEEGGDFEMRTLSRLVMHPSGERPREVQNLVVGGALAGGDIPPAVVDEIVFGSTLFGRTAEQGNALGGAGIPLLTDFAEGATDLQLSPNVVRGAGGLYADSSAGWLGQLPPDGGLLRIGSEILAYSVIDASSGQVEVAIGGRGLLGTVEESHEIGELAYFLDGWRVSLLSNGVTADDATLPLLETLGFPRQGTVLIDDELIHYTRIVSGSLDMPEASSEPGMMDREGAGLFRGRFGTTPSAHAANTPVILFPFRYWDRWADRADAPELAYFSFDVQQPGAFWQSVFWSTQDASSPGTQISVLQRSDPRVPWDADPDDTDGLDLLEQGMIEGRPVGIGSQSDHIEWRAFVRYGPQAFDALNGLSHAWKQSPRLSVFGCEYIGPTRVLRRVDQ